MGFEVLACKSALEGGGVGEGCGGDLSLDRAVPSTAADDDDFADDDVFAAIDDFAAAADDDFAAAADDDFAAAADDDFAVDDSLTTAVDFTTTGGGGGVAAFLPALVLAMPVERFACIFADDGWPKLLLRALPKLLPPARGV